MVTADLVTLWGVGISLIDVLLVALAAVPFALASPGKRGRGALVGAGLAGVVVLLAIPVQAWWDVEVTTVQLATVLAAVLVVVLVTPRDRRWVGVVPAAVLAVGLIALAAVGRNEMASEAAPGKRAEAHLTLCTRAAALADAGLHTAAAGELEAAVRAPPAEPDPRAAPRCAAAIAALADAPEGIDVTAATPRTASAPASSTPTLFDVVKRGGEEVADHLLTPLLDAQVAEEGEKKDETDVDLGPHGWLLAGGLVVLAVLGWVRWCNRRHRRSTTPTITLEDVIGPGEGKVVADVTAQVRQTLFDQDLARAPRAVEKLNDDVAGIVGESGVAGAKLLSQAIDLLRRAAGAQHSATVQVTLLTAAGAPRQEAVVELTGGSGPHVVTARGADVPELVIDVVAAIKIYALAAGAPWTHESLASHLLALDLDRRARALRQEEVAS